MARRNCFDMAPLLLAILFVVWGGPGQADPPPVQEPAAALAFDGLIRQPNAWYLKPDCPLANALVCTGQDENGRPIGVALVLPSDTTRVGLSFKIVGGPPVGRLRLMLKRNDAQVHGAAFTIPADKHSIWWVQPRRTWTFREGLYTFELVLDGESLAVLDFVVVSAPEVDAEGLPAPEYTDQPPAPTAAPTQDATAADQDQQDINEDEMAVVPVTETPAVPAPDQVNLPTEQQDLIAQALAEARSQVDEVAAAVAEELLDDLRAGEGQWADVGADWEALPAEAYAGAEVSVAEQARVLTEEALDQVAQDLYTQDQPDWDTELGAAVASGSKQDTVSAMIDAAGIHAKQTLEQQAFEQAGRVGGKGGLLGSVVDVAVGYGLGTAVKFVGRLFGGGRSRKPSNFFVCSTKTAQQLAQQMSESDGVQAALQACGGRQANTYGAAASSDTSKFGRGLLLLPLVPEPGDAAISALLIVDDVAVAVNDAPLNIGEGFSFSFRRDKLYALPLIVQAGVGGQSLQILGNSGTPLVAGSVQMVVPEAQAQDPFATIHEIIPQDPRGDRAVFICSITPGLNDPAKVAVVFALTISR